MAMGPFDARRYMNCRSFLGDTVNGEGVDDPRTAHPLSGNALD